MPHSHGVEEPSLLLLCSDWGPFPVGGVPWDPFPRPRSVRRCLDALGKDCWSGEAVGPFLTGSPKHLGKVLLAGGASKGECAGGVLGPESPPAAALRWMWLGEVVAPTHHLLQSLFTAHGASLSSAPWIQAPALATWVGRGETIIRHFSHGIGKQPCLAEIAGK